MSVASCRLKVELESVFVGKAVIRNIQHAIQSEGDFLEGKRLSVIGFGNVGANVALEAREQEAIVTVAESDPIRRLEAQLKFGLPTVPLALDAVGHSHYIVGATGRTPLGRHELERLTGNVYFANASSKRQEIDYDALGVLTANSRNTEVGEIRALTTGAALHLLGAGYPINFHSSESVPDKVMDIVLTEMLMAAARLARFALPRGVDKNPLLDPQFPIREEMIALKFQEIHFG